MSIEAFLDQSEPEIAKAAIEAMKAVEGVLGELTAKLKKSWALQCRDSGRRPTEIELSFIESMVDRGLFNLATDSITKFYAKDLRERSPFVV